MNIPTGNPGLEIIHLERNYMVDHPAGTHYALWNGPTLLDIGVPEGGFVRFTLASLTPQWTLLTDPKHGLLPVAARFDGLGVAICWLPYDSPRAKALPTIQSGGGMTDADYAAALQQISTTRYEGLMNAAWGVGGWSTYRLR